MAGMAAGAGSIDDMGLLRHGAMGVLFGGTRAASTLGSHLRSYTWGNVLQLEQAAGNCWPARPPGAAAPGRGRPGLHRHRLHVETGLRHKQQGARFGHTMIQGKSLLVTLPARFLFSAGAAGRRRHRQLPRAHNARSVRCGRQRCHRDQ
jgi:hypothetical protein